MLCRNCGTNNEDGAYFCKRCGARLVDVDEENLEEETYDDTNDKDNVKYKTKTKNHTKTKYRTKNKKDKNKNKDKKEPEEKTKVIYKDRVERKTGVFTKIFIMWLILIVIILLAVAGVFGYNYYKENYNISVPDFTNMSYEDARVKAASLNLNTKEKDKYVTDESKDDKVLSQNKKAGSKLKSGDTITLTIGKINNTYIVKNFVGMSMNDAISSLKENGINYNIIYETSNKGSDIVLSQSVKAGTTIDKGSSITLTISESNNDIESIESKSAESTTSNVESKESESNNNN